MFDVGLNEWEQTTLGSIATLGGGTTPSKAEPCYWEGGAAPWATPSDITSLSDGQNRISQTEGSVTERALRECSLPLNPPGTVLMTSRATIGYVAINDVPMTTNQGFITFRCNERADPRFLCQWLTANRAFLIAAAGGSTFKELGRGTAKLLPILLPPLDEQRRIAEVLGSVDQAVLQATLVVEQEALVRSELVSATLSGAGYDQIQQSKIGELPAHWDVEPLENVCRSVGVGIASSATHAYCEVGVPLIRNQNIKPGYLDLSDLLFVNAEYDQGYASKRIHTGDVITMRTGYPGRSAVVPRELDGCQTFTTLITKPRADRILPEFLCEWINSPTGMREVRKLQAGGAQQNLNAGVLKRLPVPVPPLEEQDRIVAALSSFTRSSDALEAARGVQKCLAIDLLSGRVRVPA
jgi:type I restriction enzyme S subunit